VTSGRAYNFTSISVMVVPFHSGNFLLCFFLLRTSA
jgi:hypothetical protein